MFSVSFEVNKFEQFALPIQKLSFPMPTKNTVVSVDKSGNPVSYFEDSVWDFNAFFNLTNERTSAYKIAFDPKKHNEKLLIDFKQRIYFLIWGEKGQLLHMEGNTFRKMESCINLANESELTLRVFKGTGIDSLSLLNNELVFSQLLNEQKRNAESTVRRRLHALSVLSSLNKHFPELSHFSIGIPEGNTIEQIAKQFSSSGKGHYPTIIPVIYEQLMGQLVQEVTLAHRQISNLKNVKCYAKKLGITERRACEVFDAFEGACFMTLSAFSGMRISELTQVDSTSYKEVELDGIKLCTLRSWTRKLEKVPREDAWACAPICKQALEVLRVLNDDYRSNQGDIHCSPRFNFGGRSGTGDNITSQSKDVFLNKKNLGAMFERYSKHLNIQYLPDEMDEAYQLLNPVVPSRLSPIKINDDQSLYWQFSTHSLRRTFAHFIVGNGLVSLAALKYQFKHVSIAMTAIYASHAEVLTLLGIENPASIKEKVEEAEMESHKAYLRDIVQHPEEQSGGYIKTFDGDPKVMSESQFEELVLNTKGANKSTGYGRCFAGFKCKMEHLFEPSSCVGRDCENLNINKEEAARWQERHKRTAVRLEQMKEVGFYNQNTLARELTDIRSAEKVMRDHNIEFVKFELGAL